jgi:sulfite reductase (NADPH) flavoprotein alpha-component
MVIHWRWVHKVTTISLGLFIFLASVTGIVLAIEPFLLKKYAVSGSIPENLTFLEFREDLNNQFLEVFSIETDKYENIKIEGIGEGDEDVVYVNANTATIVKPPKQISSLFHFCRDLHRSLFLKTPGRLLMGLASLGLLLLIISGIGLQVKRAGGWRKVFSQFKIKDYSRDGHAVWSKIFILPIAIIAFTGIVLSIMRFIPDTAAPPLMSTQLETMEINDIKLKDIIKVSFALEENEYTTIKLKNHTLEIDNNDEIVSIQPQRWTYSFQQVNYWLHTGEGTLSWAAILFITSLAMVFLSITGFIMLYTSFSKRKSRIPLKTVLQTNPDKIILVGSETGNTWRFAQTLQNALEGVGEDFKVMSLGDIPDLEGEKTIFILTATYGDGDPPENAKNVMDNLTSKVCNADKINFAVLGFGSREYPQYCTFAEELRDKLITFDNTEEIIPYSTVDNQSIFEFLEWIKLLKENLSLDLVLQTEELKPTRRRNLDTFTITDKREIGETFTLTLSHQCFIWINSGDLLGVYPCSENVERYYSIAVLGSNKFMLVIKRTGLCSNFLGNFNVGDSFKGFIKQNRSFNYPNHDQKVLMIANGTGIAPFLGMLNHKNAHLFWGSRFKNDTELFHPILKGVSIKTIFSKEYPNGYVQDLLAQHKDEIVDTITSQGTIMICGSLTMLKGVLFILDTILTHHELPTTNHLKKTNQLLIDCY